MPDYPHWVVPLGDSLYAGGEADGIPGFWQDTAQVSARRGEGTLSL